MVASYGMKLKIAIHEVYVFVQFVILDLFFMKNINCFSHFTSEQKM